jgi:hypothetical protein
LPDVSGIDSPNGGHHVSGGRGSILPDSRDETLVSIAVIVGLIVFGLLFWCLLLPLLLLIMDAMALLVLIVAGVLGRALFRRPWTVRATGGAT